MKVFYLKDKESGYIKSRFEMKDSNEAFFEGDCFNYYSWSDNIPVEDNFFANVCCKSSSCTHWNFNGEDFYEDDIDAYYHICGSYCFLNFIDSMCFVWELARRYFEKFNRNGDKCYIDDERVVRLLKEFNEIYEIVEGDI